MKITYSTSDKKALNQAKFPVNTQKNTWEVHLDAILANKGITKYKLCKDTGINKNTLRTAERCDWKLSTINKICTYLDITICELITFNK